MPPFPPQEATDPNRHVQLHHLLLPPHQPLMPLTHPTEEVVSNYQQDCWLGLQSSERLNSLYISTFQHCASSYLFYRYFRRSLDTWFVHLHQRHAGFLGETCQLLWHYHKLYALLYRYEADFVFLSSSSWKWNLRKRRRWSQRGRLVYLLKVRPEAVWLEHPEK